MARPVVTEVTEDLYEALGPLTAGDEERDWPLLRFLDALCATTVEPIAELFSDRDQPGWQIVFDPENAPASVLPYLAQFVGVQLLPSDSEERQREKITMPEQFKRGTPAAMLAAVEATLTGGRTVLMDEFFGGSAYALRIRTLASETPDEAVTEAAARSQKPIGITLDYSAVTGQDWNDVDTDHADWAAVEAAFDDWQEVKTTPP